MQLTDLLQPFFYVTDPSKRIFWFHALSSGFLILIFLKLRGLDLSLKSLNKIFMNKRYWFNESTKLDYFLLFFNSFLKIGLYVPLIGGQIVVAILVAKFIHLNFIEAPGIVIDPWLITLLFTSSAFIFDDFTRYCIHTLMHRWSFLWKFHKLHHSATTLTPFTVFRTHPVEAFINYCRVTVSLGLISGVFIWGFGRHLQVWDILGVNALGFIFTLFGSNLRHSHIPVTFGLLERWFISPAQHQLHHSVNHKHCNLGSYLSIWDRLGGTHVHGVHATELKFGLVESVTAVTKAQANFDRSPIVSIRGAS